MNTKEFAIQKKKIAWLGVIVLAVLLAIVSVIALTIFGNAAIVADGVVMPLEESTNVTITFNLNGGTMPPGIDAPHPQTFNPGFGGINPGSPFREGHIFNGWRIGSPIGTVVVWGTTQFNQDATLYAGWTPRQFGITLVANVPAEATAVGNMVFAESGSNWDSMHHTGGIFAFNSANPLPVNQFRLNGWNFNGWSLTPVGNVIFLDGANTLNRIYLDNLTRLYAIWTPHTYQIHFNSVPKFVESGLLFDNAVREDIFSYDRPASMPSASMPSLLTHNSNSITGSMGFMTLRYDHPYELKERNFAIVGWDFLGWTFQADGIWQFLEDEHNIFNMIYRRGNNAGNIILYPVFTARRTTFTINSAQGTGGISPTQTFNATFDSMPTNLPLPMPVRPAYSLTGFYYRIGANNYQRIFDSQGVSIRLWTILGSNATLIARWTPNTLRVHFHSGASGIEFIGYLPEMLSLNAFSSFVLPNQFTSSTHIMLGWRQVMHLNGQWVEYDLFDFAALIETNSISASAILNGDLDVFFVGVWAERSASGGLPMSAREDINHFICSVTFVNLVYSDFDIVDGVFFFRYTGYAIEPQIQIVARSGGDGLNGRTLIEGRDFRVSFLSNSYLGIITVEIRGIDRYFGVFSKHFYIVEELPHEVEIRQNNNIDREFNFRLAELIVWSIVAIIVAIILAIAISISAKRRKR